METKNSVKFIHTLSRGKKKNREEGDIFLFMQLYKINVKSLIQIKVSISITEEKI